MADEPLWRAINQHERLDELLGIPGEIKEKPLRRDVGSLGRLLGNVLKEQEGQKLFDTVEALRTLSISSRADQTAFQPRLEIVRSITDICREAWNNGSYSALLDSRPSRRSATRSLSDLRAIPWVFGWMQSRHGLPGWFGVGHAVERFPDQQLLRTMLGRFPLFADMIRNVEIGLAKCDLSIAALYAELVEDAALRRRTFNLMAEEFERTRAAVLRITNQTELLEDNPVLARSIRLRNPYVDPMSLIQVELLRRKRACENTAELNDALAVTINGISAGLRNTG